ncbi:hypothetical protein QWT69_13885 [Sporosarcina oncorhynchi]|uniref:DUF3098 domain-containing protein n=1 Tax=Sporosarcina oncorhynchi TaxID=3056444 RepID=A0ABZ0L2W1_9BACL|nr:hypothetical protein [Sporosarcina sp. T2O-4]WOV86949.1 hypothetical protein QWT69_13885 [Sporosarcina sp. T2O-4]
MSGFSTKRRLSYILFVVVVLIGSASLTYYNYSNDYAMGASAFPGVIALILLPFLFIKNKQ